MSTPAPAPQQRTRTSGVTFAPNTNTNDGAPATSIMSEEQLQQQQQQSQRPQPRSSTWTRQQQMFGVALRSTSNNNQNNNNNKNVNIHATSHLGSTNTVIRSTAAPHSTAPSTATAAQHHQSNSPVLYESASSIRCDAISTFCTMYGIPLIHSQVNPMLGVPIQGQLPRLDDHGASITGWHTIIKYLTWKYITLQNSFYPPFNKVTMPPSTTAANTPATAAPSSFAIDSFLASLTTFESSIDYLCQTFIQTITQGGGTNQLLPHLRHRFDRDANALLPQWQQSHPAQKPQKDSKAAISGYAHQNVTSVRHTHQHDLERHIRLIRTHLQLLNQTLAKLNPNVTSEKVVQYLRDHMEGNEGSSVTSPTSALSPASSTTATTAQPVRSNPQRQPSSTPASATPPGELELLFLLGTSSPTLADYVVYSLLHYLPLLRPFLPPLSLDHYSHLHAFTERMKRWVSEKCKATLAKSGEAISRFSLTHESYQYILLERHPLIRAFVPMPGDELDDYLPTLPTSLSIRTQAHLRTETTLTGMIHSPMNNSPLPKPTHTTSNSSGAISPVTSTTTATTKGSVSKATAVPPANVASPSIQSQKTEMTVEDCDDFMDFVNQQPSRARAHTPASEVIPPPPPLPASPTSSPPKPPTIVIQASPPPIVDPISPRQAQNLASQRRSASSLALTRVLMQKLLDTVDIAPLTWQVNQDRGGIKVMTPVGADSDNFRTMATAIFPVSAGVLLAYLWSMDSYKHLDPVRILESRELAPYGSSAHKAKYSYLSMELKSSTTTLPVPTPQPTLVNVAPTLVPTPMVVAVSSTPLSAYSREANRRHTVDIPPPPPPQSPPPVSAAVNQSPQITPAPAPAPVAHTKVSTARFDFLLLNSWCRLLDGTHILLHQSVHEDEINAPRKWTKGCVRASVGTGIGGTCSGWVLRPLSIDGRGPCVSVTYVACYEFPARISSWVAAELQARTRDNLAGLKTKMKSLLSQHPLVPVNGFAHDSHRPHGATLHIRSSQSVTPAMLNAVSAHGVQSTPHPNAKGK